jgi:hypothetical protein
MTATVKKIKIPFDEYMNLLDTARIAGTIPLGRCMGGRTIPIDEECPHCGSNQGKTLCFLPAKRRDQQ